MRDGEAPQQLFSPGAQMDQHLPAILGICLAFNKTARHHAVDQFDGGVMANLETPRDLADGRRKRYREAFHGQQKLMLMRLQSMGPGGLLRVMEETPNVMTKVGQGTIESGRGFQVIS